jgi:anaphase-promoting complex subunit 10
VLSNHQNGRDTHIRQVKIFGPRTSPAAMVGHGMEFTTTEFGQFATVR